MTIKIFETEYKAISNLFLDDIEGNHYVFPYPIELRATMKNEDTNRDFNKLEVIVPNYFDSILTIDYYVNIFFYVLTFDFILQTFLFEQVGRKDSTTDVRGYKGIYMFDPTRVVNNICSLPNEKIYNLYKPFYNEEAQP